ncbi:MAG: response regulator [Gloeomargarita sp. SKYG116]|nr:response regulator [Gloeomargarita sp. SKYG116]MDW8402103.1 response regulator [Gloeomargarita sp. SKYGB_i_bin116]
MADLPADDIVACFRAEATQLLAELEAGLLNLRREHSAAAYYRLVRAAHSLKGGAASLGMSSIQTLAQCLEEVLQTLTARPDTDIALIEDLLLQGFDCLRLPLAQWLKTGICDADFSLERAKVIYGQLTEILGPVPQTVEPMTSAELHVDIARTIFETDIAPKIAEIRATLAQPDSPLLLGELRAQFDVLAGLGEMLNFPALVRISRLALAALTYHPDQAVAIGALALGDLERMEQNPEPDPELVALSEPPLDGENSPELSSFGGDEASPGEAAITSPLSVWEEIGSFVEAASPPHPESPADTQEPPVDFEPMASPEIAGVPQPPPVDDGWSALLSPGDELHGDSQPAALEIDTSFWEEIGRIAKAEASATDSLALWEEIAHPATVTPEEPGVVGPIDAEVTLPENQQATIESLAFWEEIANSESIAPADETHDLSGEQTTPTTDSTWTGPPLPPPADVNTEALEFFAQEAQELLQELETGLLALRQHHDIPHIHGLMRAAHSIKGGAATVGWRVIQVIAHRLENALQALYQWPGTVDIALEEALLRAFDTLRQPLQARLGGIEVDTDAVLQQAEQAFRHLEAILGPAASTPGETYVPSSQDLGVDMTATIFSGDVQQGLTTLEQWLAQPTDTGLADVKSQLDVLANLGELLNLAGWRAICQTGLMALERQPEQAPAIVEVVLRDLRRGYEQVMAGEREQGGTVSPELQAFLGETTRVVPPPPEMPLPTRETPAPELAAAPRNVRVEVQRLERLNNLIGELVIQENGSFLYQQQIQQLVQQFGQRLNKLETLSRMLQDAADQLTLVSTQSAKEKPEFDPLQMDSYNQIYTSVQTVIEEIAQVSEVMRDVSLITQQAQENWRKKQQTLKQIRGDLLWMRMVPLNEILQRFPRMVRDLCVQYGKQVQVRLLGANTLVDKAVLEKLSDPLVHLVRNAFDHGIEPPDIRIQQGKKPEGIIEIQAYYRGNQTYIVVRDDGRGIDFERVRQKAIEQKIFTPEQAAQVSTSELLNCLFTPGFSTAATVSDLSGRGVGLDVVRLQIQELKGSIQVRSEPGRGTTFTIRLPLTLTITKLLVFQLEQRLLALAVDSLAGIVSVTEDAWVTVQGRRLYRWQGRLVPVIAPSVLEYRYPVRWPTGMTRGENLPAGRGQPLLLINMGEEIYGLEIDQILLEQDLVIKPLSGLFSAPAYVYGCTILGDGRLVPVIDASALVQRWLRTPDIGVVVPKAPIRTVRQTEILVVDDSLTMRGMLSKTLTKHGYQVYTAADGREALEILAQHPSIKAVVCDVEMPRMNGFEFLSICRQEGYYPNLPVIMLTSRAGEKHQQVARNLGCNAYLTKPYLEPELLATLRQFI